MKFIDWFSGIGIFRTGMEKAGHTCVGYVEIDKPARQTYNENFDNTGIWNEFDVMKVNPKSVPNADIWCAGFPCKNLSTANSTTRFGLKGDKSGLFWRLCELIKDVDNKPTYLFIENVQGFSTINGGKDFLEALCALHDLGYNIKYEISSAFEYGVPQNRIRTYLVCKLRTEKVNVKGAEVPTKKTFSIDKLDILELQKELDANPRTVKIVYGVEGEIKNGICNILRTEKKKIKPAILLKDILEKTVDKKYYLNEEQLAKVKHMKSAKVKTLKNGRIWKEGAVPFPDSIDKPARCVTPSDGSINRSTHVIFDGTGHRKLTIRERARLQCLPDTFKFPVSDSQASLQLGNGVVVKVISEIAKREIK